MKKKWIIIIIILIAVIVIALLVAGNYFYNESVKRGVEVELYSGEERIEPLASEQDQSIIASANEWFNQQQLETVQLTSYDGLLLKAAFLMNEQSSGKAVILAHGYRGTGMDMKNLVKFYYDLGFDVLLPDARGHGLSEGEYIDYGWHSRYDYQDWIEKLVNDYQAESIYLHGNSMGAALVLMASGEDLRPEVDGIIADSGYTNVKEELSHQLKYLYNLPSFPLIEITSIITKIRAGYYFGEASAVEQVKKTDIPLLIVHGDADELVPAEMAHRIYEAAETQKELWIVEGAGHTDAYTLKTSEYQKRLLNFIENSMNIEEDK